MLLPPVKSLDTYAVPVTFNLYVPRPVFPMPTLPFPKIVIAVAGVVLEVGVTMNDRYVPWAESVQFSAACPVTAARDVEVKPVAP
jgi:hypothetical protein